MPKITQVEPQKKTLRRSLSRVQSRDSGQGPHRFNVYLDGQFAFGADEDLIVSHRLVVGKIVEPEDLYRILFEVEVGRVMEKMYRLFSIRQRSEKEVRDYFRIKNLEFRIKGKEEYSDLVIEATIEVLKKKGLLNDAQFAKDWVESRRRSRQKGKIALSQELTARGIDKEIIEEVLSLKSSVVTEGQIAAQALEKKLRIWKMLEPMEFRKKAANLLMRRGFEYEVVKEVVEKYLKRVYNFY